jgi:hypothetical protein
MDHACDTMNFGYPTPWNGLRESSLDRTELAMAIRNLSGLVAATLARSTLLVHFNGRGSCSN